MSANCSSALCRYMSHRLAAVIYVCSKLASRVYNYFYMVLSLLLLLQWSYFTSYMVLPWPTRNSRAKTTPPVWNSPTTDTSLRRLNFLVGAEFFSVLSSLVVLQQSGIVSACAHREMLSNQPKIRLYLSFSGWFGSKRTSVSI